MVPTKEDNEHLPVTPEEIAADAVRVFDAGARMVHIHARDAEGKPTWFATKRRPHMQVNIRSAGESYTIFEKRTGEAVGTIDGIRAFKECHPGAVYLHRAKHYLVDHLNLEKRDIIAQYKSNLPTSYYS